ncbi:MAG TPA: DNA polymerase III subunit epsilon, partial [Burkholderiales bacterium]|nr:DNA polymerase III subunit epsilon [Burkholderiales bacterium]
DCALLADVYLALTREQISLLADEQNNINSSIDFKQIDTSKLNLKIIKPNAEELALHNEYLKVLDKESQGKSLWLKKSENS